MSLVCTYWNLFSAVHFRGGNAVEYGGPAKARIRMANRALRTTAFGAYGFVSTGIGLLGKRKEGGDVFLVHHGKLPTNLCKLNLRNRARLCNVSSDPLRCVLRASADISNVESVDKQSSITSRPWVDSGGQISQDGLFEAGSVSQQFASTVALPGVIPRSLRFGPLSVIEQAFLLLGFIACMTSCAIFALIITAIPTLNAMRRAAISMEKLADVAREELPGTMAAIRLSGMEISDLTLELNDLSQEISDGMKSSARAVRAAEVGLRRMGEMAASQTFAMIQERASVPVEVMKPAVVSAAATTLQAVAQAQQIVLNLVSHPRNWLGRKGNQEGKKDSTKAEAADGMESPSMLETQDVSSTADFRKGFPLPDDKDVTYYASSDDSLQPDEADFLIFNEVESDEDKKNV